MISLAGQSLRIGVIDHRPFTSACTFDPVCPFRGSGVEMTRIVCQALKLNCTFVPFGSAIYGVGFENGTGTGIVGAVQRGEFDTHLPNLTPNYDRFQAVDFSHAYTYSESILITRRSRVETDLAWTIVNAFNWKVWSGFLVALVTAAFLICVYTRTTTSCRPLAFVGTVLETSLSLAIINARKDRRNETRASSTLAIVWAFCIVVLSSAYSGMLFSHHIVIDSEAPFHDFETFIDCVEKQKCVVVTPVVSIASVLFLTAPGSSHAARFEKAFKKNPVRVISKDQIANSILTEDKAYLTWPTARNDLTGSIDDQMRCSFTMVPMPQIAVGTFPIRKGSRKLLESLNLMAFAAREHGLGVSVGLEPLDKQCENGASGSVQMNRVKLNLEKSLRILFYFFVMGIGVAVGVFVLEKGLAKMQVVNGVGGWM